MTANTMHKHIILHLAAIAALAVYVPMTSHAQQQCSDYIKSTTEAGRFLIQTNGTVIDKTNKLMWSHCSIGQYTQQQQCIGKAKKLSWKDAHSQVHEIGLAGFTDWRLPTVQELSLLAELRCQQPAINLDLFPNTPVGDYWSSTTFINDIGSAWLVHFGYGENHAAKKLGKAYVRMVRTTKENP